MDKGSFFFAAACGVCHPGGGPTQYDREGRLYTDGFRHRPAAATGSVAFDEADAAKLTAKLAGLAGKSFKVSLNGAADATITFETAPADLAAVKAAIEADVPGLVASFVKLKADGDPATLTKSHLQLATAADTSAGVQSIAVRKNGQLNAFFGFDYDNDVLVRVDPRLDGDYAYVRGNGVVADAAPWATTGVLEADCLMCHLGTYSWSKRKAVLDTVHPAAGAVTDAFRAAPSVGAGFATFDTATKAFTYTYAGATLNGDGQYQLAAGALQPRVGDANCKGCHSTPDGKKSGRTYTAADDVHIANGVMCVDCHPLFSSATVEKIEHQIGKGDITIGSVANGLDNTGRGCADCHLHGEHALASDPTIKHAPIPAFHFASISCQACHIKQGRFTGPGGTGTAWPDLAFDMVGSGVQLAKPWSAFTSLPGNAEGIWYPVLRNYKGRIITVKPLATAWYGDWKGGIEDGAQIAPIPLRLVRKALLDGYAIPTPNPAFAIPSTEADVKAKLLLLKNAVDDAAFPAAAPIAANPVMVKAETVFFLEQVSDDGDGIAEAAEYALGHFESLVGETHDFAINHLVRPSGEAWGSGGCTDCHAPDSPFFMREHLVDAAAFGTGAPAYRPNYASMGLSPEQVGYLTADQTTVLVRNMGQYGVVAGAGGLACGTANSGVCTTLLAPATYTLTAEASAGSKVTAWSGCDLVEALGAIRYTAGGPAFVTYANQGVNQALSAYAIGPDVIVSLATDASGVATSTAADVVAAVNASASASKVARAELVGEGTTVLSAMARTAIDGPTSTVAADLNSGTCQVTIFPAGSFNNPPRVIQATFAAD